MSILTKEHYEEGRVPRKVIFLIPNLMMGGAERVFTNYINHMEGIEPIALLHRREIVPANELRADIPCFDLSSPIAYTNNKSPLWLRCFGFERGVISDCLYRVFGHYRFIARLIEAYRIKFVAEQLDCFIVSSFLNQSNKVALLAKVLFSRRLRVIINVHEFMSQHIQYDFSSTLERAVHYWMTRLLFPQAELIVAVADGVKQDLITHFKVPSNKITVIHNPIDIALIRQKSTEPMDVQLFDEPSKMLVITVGRLVKAKGFDLLVKAFAELPDHIGANLLILGEGKERATIEQLIKQFRLDRKVLLLGATDNPWAYMVKADLIVLSSRTEAFPNVIGEAFVLGLPMLATNCSPGVAEYLQNGRFGHLIPSGDIKALANGMERLLVDHVLRSELTTHVAEHVESFDLRTITKKYEAVLGSAM